MQAFIMNEARDLVVSEVAAPTPKDDNIILAVKAASICGTDIRTFLKGNAKIDPPRVLGHECAGVIIHAGSLAQSKGYALGDRVTVAPAIGCGECAPCKKGHTNMCDHLETIGFQFDGVFASLLEIPAKAIRMGNVIPLPESISDEDATLIEPAACALNGQSYMHITAGDVVVVYGGGMIGCIHAELALLRGAKKVIIVEPVAKRGKIIQEKVSEAIWLNPSTQNVPEEVARISEGRGADVVIVATSVPAVHTEAQIIAAKMGRISIFGGLPGDGKGFLDSNLIHYKELQICGVHATTPAFMRQIMEMMESGELDARKYIERIIPLDDIEKGFTAIRDENVMKVVIKPE